MDQEVRKFYDMEAGTYDRDRSGPYFSHLRKVEKEFLRYLAEPILDIGSGTGKVLKGREFVAVDISREMLKRNPGARVMADAEALPFKDSSFPSATALLISLAFTDIQKSMSEVRRVLKKGGKFLLSIPVKPGKEWFRHKGRKIRYRRVERDWMPKGFRLIERRFVFGRLKPKWRNFQSSLIDKVLMASEMLIPPSHGDVMVLLLEKE